MAVQVITDPMMLDSTGQSILAALNTIAANIDTGNSTFRKVPISVAANAWSGSGSSWSATQDSVYVTGTSYDIVLMDESMANYPEAAYIVANKKSVTGGGITFTATAKPSVTISGMLYILDANDGKVPVLMENTVVGIANGGTNAATLAGAQSNLGITALGTRANNLAGSLAILATGNTHIAITSGYYVYVKDHGTLAEGLYQATANIAANATLSTSNLTAKSTGLGGEVKALSDQIVTLNSNTAPYLDLGNISGSSVKAVLENAWDATTVKEKTVMIRFYNSGMWAGYAYKDAAGTNGNLVALRKNTDIFIINVDNGTKTCKQCNTTTIT